MVSILRPDSGPGMPTVAERDELPVGMPSLDVVLVNSLCAVLGHWCADSVLMRFSVRWIRLAVSRRWQGAQRAEVRVF